MISYRLVDLDNPLYPEASALGAELSRRINQYAAEYLGVSEQEALRLRRTEARNYGTTMRWLVEEHGHAAIYFAEHTHIPASRETPYAGGGELPRKYAQTSDLFAPPTAAAADRAEPTARPAARPSPRTSGAGKPAAGRPDR